MSTRRSNYGLVFRLLSLFGLGLAVFLAFLSRTDIANLLRKSSYAEWATAMESALRAKQVELLQIDFGTYPSTGDKMHVALAIAEPTYEFGFNRLFMDVHRVIIDTYLQSEPQPPAVDYISVVVVASSGFRYGVRAPFQAAKDYAQGAMDSEAYMATWEVGVDESD